MHRPSRSPILCRKRKKRGSAQPAINECARMVIRSVRLGTCPGNESISPPADTRNNAFIHALADDRPSEFITLTAELHSRCGRRIALLRPVSSRRATLHRRVIKKFRARTYFPNPHRAHRSTIQLSSKRSRPRRPDPSRRAITLPSKV